MEATDPCPVSEPDQPHTCPFSCPIRHAQEMHIARLLEDRAEVARLLSEAHAALDALTKRESEEHDNPSAV